MVGFNRGFKDQQVGYQHDLVFSAEVGISETSWDTMGYLTKRTFMAKLSGEIGALPVKLCRRPRKHCNI